MQGGNLAQIFLNTVIPISYEKRLSSSVAEPEPPEPYHFDPRTGTVFLL
jgi:hypothetical protein